MTDPVEDGTADTTAATGSGDIDRYLGDAPVRDEDVREPHVVQVSAVDAKDRRDLQLQRIIDDLARRSEGREHQEVTADLVERIADAELPPMPQPWVDAVGAAAICGNAYVVSSTAAALSDVPAPQTRRPAEDLT
ncbi:MAG: hypothetical protein JWP82_403 [Humibacillus sp.]|nr:hypothetical protein [Humibacillus sp.]